MERVPTDEYELDYLITPELGGAPTLQNLLPQRYASRPWNAHVKDQLERLLPRLVCDGAISLQTAQGEIAVDWIAAYRKYLRTDVPLQTHASLGTAAMALEDDTITYPVWRSGDRPALRLISFSPSRLRRGVRRTRVQQTAAQWAFIKRRFDLRSGLGISGV